MLHSYCLMSSGISSVAHHNLHINAIFVYLFMQELFVDKTHFFKFLCMSDKPLLHQLNIINSSRSSTVQPSLTGWIFSFVQGNTIKEGEILENKTSQNLTKPHQLIKHAIISYSIASLVFSKFSYWTYRNGLNQVPQSWGTTSISKSTNRVSVILFVRNPHFSILLHRERYLKHLFMSRRWRLIIFPSEFKIRN